MKGKINIIILSAFLFSLGWGQLRSDLPSLEKPETMHMNLNQSSGLSLFDPARFDMHHNFSMSMISSGGLSFSVGSYTNQMSYWIKDNLRLDTDITLMQPMASNPLMQNGTGFSPNILVNTSLTYRPTENSIISFSIGNNPYSMHKIYSPLQLRAF